jgi:hydrogenase-4 component E
MSIAHLPSLAASLFSVLAIASLLLSFVMLGSRWLKQYLYAFAAESWTIAGISAAVAYFDHFPELYLIAGLTVAFCGLVLPWMIWRMIGRLDSDREFHEIVQPASGLVIGALFVMFALTVSYQITGALSIEPGVVVLALTVMLAMKLIGFLLLAVRREAISQILGLMVLENGIFLGSQILVPGMPLLIEVVVLFDLLVLIACFGVLVAYLQTIASTTSAGGLKRLVG